MASGVNEFITVALSIRHISHRAMNTLAEMRRYPVHRKRSLQENSRRPPPSLTIHFAPS